MNAALDKMVRSVKMQASALNHRTTLFLLAADLLQEHKNMLGQAIATIDVLKAELNKYEPDPDADGRAIRTETRKAAQANPHRPAGAGDPDPPAVGSPALERYTGEMPGVTRE